MGKNILVIAATAKEIGPFLKALRQNSGQLAGHNIDVLITGVGLTATTYHLLRQLSLKRPQVVTQAGIAGSFDKQMILGSVVAVKQDRIADEAVMEGKKLQSVFDLKLASRNKFPYSGGWLINKSSVLSKTKLKKVEAVSVNQVTTSKEMVELYRKKFHPAIESMEGAAMHYVCLSENIPFIQIRGISNYIGERNKKNWKMKEAIVTLNTELLKLIEKL